MIQAEIRKGEEELRMTQLVQMGSQGCSTKWNLPERKLTWSGYLADKLPSPQRVRCTTDTS